jgi:hypothetical protein
VPRTTDIKTNQEDVACDICGRTLLRGEHGDVFLHGGVRRTVCDLCTPRAAHEGWIREGLDEATVRAGTERAKRSRSLLGRLRQRRQEREPQDAPDEAPAPRAPAYDPATYDPAFYDPAAVAEAATAPEAGPPARPEATASPRAGGSAPATAADGHGYEPPREPRTVHAVPTNDDLKVARALQVFNGSAHPRTVAGVARSLGSPMVSAHPSRTEGSVVSIVVGWELSWYRYEVDLGDEASGVRVVAQGSELTELPAEDAEANAAADEYGELHPLASVA